MANEARHVEERWRALWEDSPQRSPFSRLAYLRAVSSAVGLNLSVHFVDVDGVDEAGFAATWKRQGPYRTVVVPPFTPFSALLLRHRPAESDIHARSSPFGAILREVEHHYDAAHLQLHPSIRDVRPAQWRKWDAHPLYTYVVDLKEGVDVLAGWSASSARNYRTARDDYELIEGIKAVSAAIRLSRESYARHGRTAPLSEDALRRLADGTGKFSRAYAVRRKDASKRVDAAIVTLADAGRAYYWIAGSIPGSGMTVLVGDVLTRLDRQTTQLFDFVGANTPTIAEFKRRFGCRLENYYRIVYYGRRDLQLLHMLREAFRR